MHMGKLTNAYRSLVGKPLGWKDKIKTSLKKIGSVDVNSIDVAHDRCHCLL